MQIQDQEKKFAEGNIELPDDCYFFSIVGGNNSGKSTVLRSIAKTFHADSCWVDVNRSALKGEGAFDQSYSTSQSTFINQQKDQNSDNLTDKNIKVLQDIKILNNSQREEVIKWYNAHFPNEIYLERQDTDNDASPLFLKVDGFPITDQGSGIRATLEIFVRLLDPKIKILCIDEPELGLEPILQKNLLRALKEKAGPEKKIFIGTHSHHFLDYDNVQSNYICGRNKDKKILLHQVNHQSELRNIVFRLLGNTLSGLMLPEKFLIMEGISDSLFVSSALNLLSKKNYALHESKGVGSIKYAVNSITEFIRIIKEDIPLYKDKTWILIDERTASLKDVELREWKVTLGESKVKVLSKNGIEYYYPEKIIQEIFSCPDKKIDEIISEYLANEPNSYNNILLTKHELAKEVVSKLTKENLTEETSELLEFLKQLP